MEEVRRRIAPNQPEHKPKYAPADDSEFIKQAEPDVAGAAKNVINDSMNNAEDEFINFVSKHLQKMDKKLLFDGEHAPSLAVLNNCLSDHSHVMLALTGLYEQNRWDKTQAQDDFDTWYAEKFIEVRTEVNKDDLAKSKWYTKEEIDYMIKVKYKKEYKAMKDAVNLAESKRSFLQRLVDGWNSYQFILTQLSRNSIAEYSSEGRAGYTE